MLHWPIRPLRKYLGRTENYCPASTNVFVLMTGRNGCPETPISFWIRSVSHVYGSATDADCESVKIKAEYGSGTDADCESVKIKSLGVWKLGTNLLFRMSCSVQQVLKAGMYSSQVS